MLWFFRIYFIQMKLIIILLNWLHANAELHWTKHIRTHKKTVYSIFLKIYQVRIMLILRVKITRTEKKLITTIKHRPRSKTKQSSFVCTSCTIECTTYNPFVICMVYFSHTCSCEMWFELYVAPPPPLPPWCRYTCCHHRETIFFAIVFYFGYFRADYHRSDVATVSHCHVCILTGIFILP